MIGETCSDEYIFGECTRISPEAPVPVMRYVETKTVPGMAWNVVCNLNAFPNVDIQFITQKEKIVKTRYVDKKFHHQILRLDYEPKVTPFDEDDLPTDDFDCVIISDYNKGFLDWETVVYMDREFTCPVFLDSKKKEIWRTNAYVKVNEQEYYSMGDKPDNIIITLGDKGAKYKNKIYPAEKVDVFDVCGAGDTFLAALTYFYLRLGSIEAAIPLANKAGAIAVSHFGTYTLTKEDINEICN